MAKIEKIEDIDIIKVHWSESKIINDELRKDKEGDIEKDVDPFLFDEIIRRASKDVDEGFDKTNLSIKLKNGIQWCSECKFYITKNDTSLLKLINKGE